MLDSNYVFSGIQASLRSRTSWQKQSGGYGIDALYPAEALSDEGSTSSHTWHYTDILGLGPACSCKIILKFACGALAFASF